MVRRAAVTSLVVVVLLVGFAPTVLAQEAEETQQNSYLGDRFAIRIIGGLVDLNTDVAAGRGLGALIDIEDLLGFDESITSFGFDGFWRFEVFLL